MPADAPSIAAMGDRTTTSYTYPRKIRLATTAVILVNNNNFLNYYYRYPQYIERTLRVNHEITCIDFSCTRAFLTMKEDTPKTEIFSTFPCMDVLQIIDEYM